MYIYIYGLGLRVKHLTSIKVYIYIYIYCRDIWGLGLRNLSVMYEVAMLGEAKYVFAFFSCGPQVQTSICLGPRTSTI